jgi:hypothetical protein
LGCEADKELNEVCELRSSRFTVHKYLIHKGEAMTFEQKLYEQVRMVLPNTTTRTFSRDCGMSANYYCSLQSQCLPISTAALLHLAEVLEHRQALEQTVKPVSAVLQMLAEEIALRRNNISSGSFTVQRLVTKAIAAAAFQRDYAVNVPTISMGWL